MLIVVFGGMFLLIPSAGMESPWVTSVLVTLSVTFSFFLMVIVDGENCQFDAVISITLGVVDVFFSVVVVEVFVVVWLSVVVVLSSGCCVVAPLESMFVIAGASFCMMPPFGAVPWLPVMTFGSLEHPAVMSRSAMSTVQNVNVHFIDSFIIPPDGWSGATVLKALEFRSCLYERSFTF